MSNKIVPTIYRAVIDEVIKTIKPEFDEFGVGEDVLAELQHKWESKVIASHVADFETPHAPNAHPPHPHMPHPPHPMHHPYPPHPMHFQHPHYSHNPYAPQPVPPHPPPPASQQQPGQPVVKAEPLDSRYILSGASPYAIPALLGPQLNGTRPQQLQPPQQSVLSFPTQVPPPGARPAAAPAPPTARAYAAPTSGVAPPRIPQLDGPSSSSSSGSPSPPPSSLAQPPPSSHPSLPQPSGSVPSSQVEDSEAINSDLDDSDTEGEDGEGEEGGVGETDIVFCTYDKVARVKNKWKCILKDGMIHINGRDYLFAKCTGEFEW